MAEITRREFILMINSNNPRLRGLDLSGLDLTALDLSGLDLTRVNLSEADLTDARMVNVDLSHASLDGVNLTRTDLTGARVTVGQLAKAESLRGAALAGGATQMYDVGDIVWFWTYWDEEWGGFYAWDLGLVVAVSYVGTFWYAVGHGYVGSDGSGLYGLYFFLMDTHVMPDGDEPTEPPSLSPASQVISDEVRKLDLDEMLRQGRKWVSENQDVVGQYHEGYQNRCVGRTVRTWSGDEIEKIRPVQSCR